MKIRRRRWNWIGQTLRKKEVIIVELQWSGALKVEENQEDPKTEEQKKKKQRGMEELNRSRKAGLQPYVPLGTESTKVLGRYRQYAKKREQVGRASLG